MTAQTATTAAFVGMAAFWTWLWITTEKRLQQSRLSQLAALNQLSEALHRENAMLIKVRALYDVLAHGDVEHRKWLKDKLVEHFRYDS